LSDVGAIANLAFLESGEHRNLALLERGLETIEEADAVRVFEVGR